MTNLTIRMKKICIFAVGVNGITAQQVVNRLAEKRRKEREQEEALEKIEQK